MILYRLTSNDASRDQGDSVHFFSRARDAIRACKTVRANGSGDWRKYPVVQKVTIPAGKTGTIAALNGQFATVEEVY